jgi:ABC-type transporter Mla MlaB component
MSLASFKRPLAKEKVPVSATPLAPSVDGPDTSSLDSLQTKADGSAQVSDLQALADSSASATTEQINLQEAGSSASVPQGKERVKDDGTSDFTEKKVAGGVGMLNSSGEGVGAIDKASMSSLLLTEVQAAAQAIYTVRDLYQKRDWKTGAAMMMDVVNGFLKVEAKINAIGIPGLANAIPFIGGAITGFRQMLNVSRVMESMSILEQVMQKASLDEDDKKILKAYQKEQKISQYKHITQSVLGFARFVAEFFGVGSFVAVGEGIVAAVFIIRDMWNDSKEQSRIKAQKRLGIEEMSDGDSKGISELNELFSTEDDIEYARLLVTGSNFSIMNLVTLYNLLETERKKLSDLPFESGQLIDQQERVEEMETSVSEGLDQYNSEMMSMVPRFDGVKFKPVTIDKVKLLHDYHVTCMHQVLLEAKSNMESVEWSLKGLYRKAKGEKKQDILKQVYGGKVPEKIDIKIGELTADQQQKFWEKTQSALQNALNAHISKKTLVNEMRQIMLRNKDSIIQGMVAGGSDLFTSEQNFEQDMNRMLNTVNL